MAFLLPNHSSIQLLSKYWWSTADNSECSGFRVWQSHSSKYNSIWKKERKINNFRFRCRNSFFFSLDQFSKFRIIDLLKWNKTEWNRTEWSESDKEEREKKVTKLSFFFSIEFVSLLLWVFGYTRVQLRRVAVQWKCVNSQCEEVCAIAFYVCWKHICTHAHTHIYSCSR